MTPDEKRKAKAAYMRERRAKFPERTRAIRKKWTDAHPGYYTEYLRKWREANREHLREYQRKWSAKRRAAAKAAKEADKGDE